MCSSYERCRVSLFDFFHFQCNYVYVVMCVISTQELLWEWSLCVVPTGDMAIKMAIHQVGTRQHDEFLLFMRLSFCDFVLSLCCNALLDSIFSYRVCMLAYRDSLIFFVWSHALDTSMMWCSRKRGCDGHWWGQLGWGEMEEWLQVQVSHGRGRCIRPCAGTECVCFMFCWGSWWWMNNNSTQ